MGSSVAKSEHRTEETAAVVTQDMIEAGLIAARRGGLGPVASYQQFERFKSGLVAAYRAMRAAAAPDADWRR